MRVQLITHTDLDAGGCAVLAKYAFTDVDIMYCDNKKVDEKVTKFIDQKKYEEYDMIFITDISVNDEVAERINTLFPEKIILLDHHTSEKERLSKFKWAFVDLTHKGTTNEEETVGSSGTTLFYFYLLENNLLDPSYKEKLLPFVEQVRQFDTWEWKTKFKNNEAKKLNNLFYHVGRAKFLERFSSNYSIEFTEEENFDLNKIQERFDKYVTAKASEMTIHDILGHKAGVVFAEEQISELGNKLAEKYVELDFIVLIDMGQGKISYRSIKENVNLGVIAKHYGGGGREQTAGSAIADTIKSAIINQIFTTNNDII